MKRIVFTVATTHPKYAEQALGLARSLKLIGDTTTRVLMTDLQHEAFSRNFDEVVPPPKAVSTYMLKLAALEATDADEVLFIDSDSLVFKRLAPVFDYCGDADFAVQGRWIREGHWYGWMEQLLPSLGLAEMPRFNGGMMFYRRSPGTQRLIDEARRAAENYDSTGLDRFRGTIPDEPCVALGMARSRVGKLIPDTEDFMNTPVGLVGDLDMDVMRARCRFMKHSMHDLRLMEPMILHAGKYVNNAIYWKQLAKLEWLERYEQAHSYGYMPPLQKLRRSTEKRILKMRKIL